MQITELAVDRLYALDNPRTSMDEAELAELAESIKQNGILEPIRAVPSEDGSTFVIESGHRRYAAALSLGMKQVPVTIIENADQAQRDVAAIVTNVQRSDLNPVDEANAYLTLATRHGLTPVGIAERVGVNVRRVNDRLDLLELPESVIELFRTGELTPGCRAALREMQQASPSLVEFCAKACAGKPDWLGVLSAEPGRVALWATKEKPAKFAAVPANLRIERENNKIGPVKLTKPLQDLLKTWDEMRSYPSYYLEIGEDCRDSAITLGIAYRADEHAVVVSDMTWLRDAIDISLHRAIADAKAEQERAAKQKAAQMTADGKVKAGEAPSELDTQVKEFRREHRAALEEGKRLARAANLELGRALLNEFASVDVGKLTVDQAKAVAFGLVGPTRGELFLGGLRYVLPEFQREETIERKNGNSTTKIHYVDTMGEGSRLVTEWLNRAKKPGELVGRALILLAAAAYCDQGAVPGSQQKPSGLPRMHVSYSQGNDEKSNGVAGLPFEKALLAAVKAAVPRELKAKEKPSRKVISELHKRTAQQVLHAAGHTIAADR